MIRLPTESRLRCTLDDRWKVRTLKIVNCYVYEQTIFDINDTNAQF